MPAGKVLILWVASANRDAAQFVAPDTFDIGRTPNPHLSFGHGIHFCIGAPLARMEARAAMGALIDRFATISPGAEPGRRLPGGLLYGFRELPVVFG